MKRIQCVLIYVYFVLFAGAAWSFELTPGNVSGSPGTSITVPIHISNITNELSVDAFGFTVQYDSGLVSFDQVEKIGTFSEGFDLVKSASLGDGTAKVSGVKWGDALMLNADAVFVNLIFSIHENANGNSELILSNIKDDIKSAAPGSGILTIMASPSADTDNDGMPDEWETAHGLDPNQPSDAYGDADGDGVYNADEYKNGTDPQTKDYYFIRGTVNYEGNATGYLEINAYKISNTESDSESDSGEEISFPEPAGVFSAWWEFTSQNMNYTISVPNGTYTLKAFIDTNENEITDSAEPQGEYETQISIAGADDSADRNITLSQVQAPVFSGTKIYAGDADADDWFGYFRQSVSIEGDLAVVGAPEYNSADEKGGAYVYRRSGNAWMQIAKLTASDGMAGDNFGHAVDISGDQIIIGRFISDQSVGYNVRKGAAYIFEKPEEGWRDMTETAILRFTDDSTPNPFNNTFGRQVAVSDSCAVVSAYWDSKDAYKSGAVYVFEKPEGGWVNMTETAMLKPDSPDYREGMGTSVDIDGDTIAAGGAGYGNNAGAIRIFQRIDGSWTHTQTLQAEDTAAYHNIGHSVKLDGDTLIAGADHMYPSAESDGFGTAYIFQSDSGVWTQKAKLISSDLEEDDLFGFSVGISDGIAAVGAWGDDDKGNASGAVYYFQMPSEGWKDMTETAKIVPNDGRKGARFGYSVSVSGTELIASAPLDDDKGAVAGAAYIYTLADMHDGGLTAYYPFSENVTDESGNGHEGTLTGGTFTEGRCGGTSLDFSGEGRNNVRLPGSAADYLSEDGFTVSMWIKSTGMKNKAFDYLIHFNDDRPGIRLNDENKIYFAYKASWNAEPLANEASAGLLSESPVPLNVWTHVACRWDGSIFSGYVDGKRTGEIELPYFILGNAVHIGSDGYDLRDFEGSIDDVRLYDRVLSETEIQELSKPCDQNIPAGTVSIVPASPVIRTGETMETEIRISGSNIWAVHAEVSADPEALVLKNSGKYGGIFPVKFRFEVPPFSDADAGEWTGAMSLIKPEEPFTGEGVFAKLKYTAASGIYGDTEIIGQVSFADQNGNLTGVHTVKAVITVDDGIHGGDGIIQGHITLPDGTPVAGAEVTISLDGKEYTVTTDENGHYILEELKDLSPGASYAVTASKDGFSASETVDSVENPVTLDMEILNGLLADLNKDGVVDIADFTLLANAYGLSEGEPGYDSRADIKPDGKINIQDLALLGSYWP